MKLNKIDEVWSCANSLFKWRSRFVLIPWQRDLTTSPLQWVHRKSLSPVSQVRKGRRRVGARNSRNKANMAKYKVVTFAPVIALATLSYKHNENFTKDLEVRRDIGNRASPIDRAHVKRPLGSSTTSSPGLFPQKMVWGKSPGDEVRSSTRSRNDLRIGTGNQPNQSVLSREDHFILSWFWWSVHSV